jgi:hypothetical protein
LGLWRDILRVLGLTTDTRVHISAPGIDVIITGEPDQVRHLLSVVKHELERVAVRADRKKIGEGQVVRPTELDEMDSPYALPEAEEMVMPVRKEEITDEIQRKKEEIVKPGREERTPVDDETIDQPYTAMPARAEVRVTPVDPAARSVTAKRSPARDFGEGRPEAATLLPAKPFEERPSMSGAEDRSEPEHGTKIDSKPPLEPRPLPRDTEHTRFVRHNGRDEDTPPTPAEATEIAKNPSGPVIVPGSESNPFVTDGGPTLTPADSQNDLYGTDPEKKALRDSNPEVT